MKEPFRLMAIASSDSLVCNGCGAALYRQWYDAGRSGYACRSCGALTPSAAAPPAPVATPPYSRVRIALNALGVLIFPILWILVIAGIANGNSNYTRIAKYVLIVYGVLVALYLVARLGQA
ncbi:MAG TPA: hypothetical protein VIC63_05470 [Candidatus Limnocylindria bacterium]